jgi:hypothetical protein
MTVNPSADIPDRLLKEIADLPLEMRQAIEGFTRHTDGLVNSFSQPIIAKQPPPIIFHYTDDVGLRGILETGTLWLTDIFYLNDPSELRYGCKLDDEFKTAAAAAGAEERPFIAEFAANLAGRLQHEALRVRIFLCCLSAKTGTIWDNGEPMLTMDAVTPWDLTLVCSNRHLESQG